MKITREPIYVHPDTLVDLRALLPPDSPSEFAHDPADEAVRLREMREAFISGIKIRTTELLKRGEYIQLPPLRIEMPEPVFKFSDEPFVTYGRSFFRYAMPKFGLSHWLGFTSEDSWERVARHARERKARKLAMKKTRRLRIKADNARRATRR